MLDWSTGVYNPMVDITADTTTLYASDRDVFLFLVDDLNPIEAGKLPDGSPDLYFRGFCCWNSEVGAKALGIASFYLRAVCQNRNLWGVEDFEEISIRHSKYAANRCAHEAAPALTRFADSSPMPFVKGIRQARERIVARSDEDRTDFLRKRGFGKAETAKIIDTVLAEEGRPPESVFDFVQGITAFARGKGQSEEEIAAHQFVSVAVVKQRLKLAGVSPKILDAYAKDAITLDQLMAFTVNGDHERQEQVYERLAGTHDRQPYTIRRLLTEGAVRASDKRARFIDIDAYVEAGGSIMRDLFQGDDGGWLQDVGLVDLMVSERLREEAMKVQAEGWHWIDAAPDFPYGHTYGLRQLRGTTVEITAEEQATRDALQAEFDALVAEHEDLPELPDEVDERLGELETAIEALDQRPLAFDPEEVARAVRSSASRPMAACGSNVRSCGLRTSCRSSRKLAKLGMALPTPPMSTTTLSLAPSSTVAPTTTSNLPPSRRRMKAFAQSPTG